MKTNIQVAQKYFESLTKGDLQTARLSISRSNFAISEAKNRIKEKIDTFKAEASRDLQKTVSQINKFEAILFK